MQILVQNNRVVDYCPEDSYICFGSFITCESKNKTFYDCTIVTLINTELPSDIDSSEYLYIEGSFIRVGAKVVTKVNGITPVNGNVELPPAPVSSVNGKTGDVVVDLGVTSVNNKTGAVTLKESPSDMTDYIIESYRNGTEWYEIYKSGKVRQGFLVVNSDSSVTVNLIKAYANTDYTIVIGAIRTLSTGTSPSYEIKDGSVTNTSFVVHASSAQKAGVYVIAEG